MQVNDIFRESEYSNAWQFVKENLDALTIKELEADENGRRFQIVEIPPLTEKEKAEQEIFDLKQKLAKYKEDVEQVELFGMDRTDYEEKKKTCAEIIVRLRELEKFVKNN